MARDLDLNINGDARRAQQALNDVANGAARAARVNDHLAQTFDHLENEANDAQRAIDRINDEIAQNGPTAELSAELAELQRRLSEISDERFNAERLRAGFRNATAAAAQLDRELADVRRELDRLNDEYARGGDPAVLRRIQEQQRALNQLNATRRRIAAEDEENQRRLARMAEEARQAQARRDDEERRRQEDEDNRSFLRRLARRTQAAGDGLQGAPVPPQAMAVGAAIGASAAVPLLAAIGGALTGAVGFGIAGAGIAGAIMGDPDRFKTAWSDAASTVKTEFLDATAVFSGPTLEAIRGIGPLVKSWNLGEMFAGAAKFVPVIVDGVEDFATGIVRGVSAMVDKGEPAVKALSAGLGEIGDAAGDAFEDIAGEAEGGAEALRDVLFATAAVVRGFGEVTAAAERAYGYIHDHPVEAALLTMGASLPITLLDQFSDETDQAAISLDDATLAANGAAGGGKAVADAWEGAAAAMQDAADTADLLFDAQMGVADAAVGWEQSIDDLTDSIKENGRNWDITTQKGRDNTSALMDSINAAKAVRDANIENGMSVAEANRKYEQQIAYLQGVATKAGLTKAQFDAMTAALLNYINAPMNKTITTKFIDLHYVSTEGRIGSGEDPRTKTGRGYASGGPVASTGFSLVGEQGPELHFMSKGDYVATAAETKAMLGGGGMAYAPVINVNVYASAGADLYAAGKQVADVLRAYVEPSGGDLQQVVMRRSGV